MIEPNTIARGDCLKLMKKEPDGRFDMVFADPPFNIGYRYNGYQDNKPDEVYEHWCRDWMAEVKRVLRPGGAFWLAIGDKHAAELCVAAKKLGFIQRNWVIWHYTFGQQTKQKFALSHTHLLYFVTDGERTFNADDVRVPSARQTTYKDGRANPKGKLPDDVWYHRPQSTDEHFDPTDDTWYVSRVAGTFGEREGWHGCQMPLIVLERIIRACTNAGDLVLDPFSGSGTTAVAAAGLERQFIGLELDAKYAAHARKRLEGVRAGESGADRASRMMTEKDAMGRPRVPRGPRRVKAAPQRVAGTD